MRIKHGIGVGKHGNLEVEELQVDAEVRIR